MQFHLQTVHHSKGCNITAFQEMWNVTHMLLVIGKHVMRLLHFTIEMCKCYLQTVDYKLFGDYLSQNVDECYLQAVGHVIRQPFTNCEMLLTSCWS